MDNHNEAFSLVEFVEQLTEARDERIRSKRRAAASTATRRRWRKVAQFQRIRCVRCDAPASRPFASRPPCICGSVCWYEGERPRPLWRAVTSPAFLAISTEDFEARQS